MAVQEYVKTALSNLNGAVTHLQNEIQSDKSNLDQERKGIERDISVLQVQVSTFDQERGAANDTNDEARLGGLIVIENNKIKDKQRELSEKQANITRMIQDKERLVQQLQDVTRQVEQLSYAPALRSH